MTAGVSTNVYRGMWGNVRIYLRILPEGGATFAPEVRAHQLARTLGCRVPDVLAYLPSDPSLGRSVMLTSEIPGQPLPPDIEPQAAREVIQAAGRDLARINSIPVAGFGWIDRAHQGVDRELSAHHEDVATMLEVEYQPIVDSLADDAIPGIDPARLRQGLLAAIESTRGDKNSRLAHGDFDTSHIFIHEGCYSGIIDFGEIRGMPFYYDLAHHRMHDRERLPYSTLNWLIEGYREIRSLPADIEQRLSAMSLLIATRALYRGLQRASDSQIIRTARRAIRREIAPENPFPIP